MDEKKHTYKNETIDVKVDASFVKELRKQLYNWIKNKLHDIRPSYFREFNIVYPILNLNRDWDVEAVLSIISNPISNEEELARINRVIIALFRLSYQTKDYKLAKFIITNFTFIDIGNDIEAILDRIIDVLTNYHNVNFKTLDEFIVIIFDKYGDIIIEMLYEFSEPIKFIIYWIIFFHPKKIKEYIEEIFDVDYRNMLFIVTNNPKYITHIISQNICHILNNVK